MRHVFCYNTGMTHPYTNHAHYEPHKGDFASKLNWLRAAVLGANDGIVSIAALVVGVAGASVSSSTILITGVAGLLAGAFSMAAGEYVSVSSQKDTEQALLAKERHELATEAQSEFEELTEIYENKGLSYETAKQVAKELTDHDVFRAHAEAELGIDPDKLTNPVHASFASALSYSIGGLIPLVTIMLPGETSRLAWTYGAVGVALVLLGVVSARLSGAPILKTTLRVLVGGIAAMVITFYAGKFLGGVGL